MREYKLLKGINLVLKSHEVGDRFVADNDQQLSCMVHKRQLANSPFIRIVDRLQTDILFILEKPIELRMLTVKCKFGEQKEDIFPNKRSVAFAVLEFV